MSSKSLERIIEPLIVNLMQQSKIPGLALSVIKDGKPFYAKIPYPFLPKPTILPLAPENIDELKFVVPIAFPGMRMESQFFIDEKTSEVRLIVDRYNFHKI